MLFADTAWQPLIGSGPAGATPSGSYDAWVVAATPVELLWALAMGEETPSAGPLWGEGVLDGLRLAFLSTGVGPVNAAMALSAFGQRCSTALILNCGVAGAYPGSGLAVGHLAVATEEIDTDTGIEPSSVTEAVSPLPLALHHSEELPFGRYPLEAKLSAKLEAAAQAVCPAKRGPFVTSATVTSTSARAEKLENAYDALCENMEGAALARVALELGIEMVEVRGISNIAGPRDRASWKLKEAIAASGEAAHIFLTGLAEAKRGR